MNSCSAIYQNIDLNQITLFHEVAICLVDGREFINKFPISLNQLYTLQVSNVDKFPRKLTNFVFPVVKHETDIKVRVFATN